VDPDHRAARELIVGGAVAIATLLYGMERKLVCELSEVELDRKRRAWARHTSQTREVAAVMVIILRRRDRRRRWAAAEAVGCGIVRSHL
jgi:hypothetical protein